MVVGGGSGNNLVFEGGWCFFFVGFRIGMLRFELFFINLVL